MADNSITILSPEELVHMRKACRLAADLLSHLGKLVCPGISTDAINQEAESFTRAHGARSAPLGYGFPKFTKSICTSVNEVVCHGIPNPKHILKDGDIINIDVSPVLNGYYGDTSRTFFVGTPSPKAKKLVEVTKECLRLAILEVAPDKRLGDIGAAIQEYAESFGYGVVREFVGHGIGKSFHTEPQVAHYGTRGKGRRLIEGMTFTIEPMINEGTWKTKVLSDGWTALTLDGKLSAQFEHTILVTKTGFEVLTLREGEIFRKVIAGLAVAIYSTDDPIVIAGFIPAI